MKSITISKNTTVILVVFFFCLLIQPSAAQVTERKGGAFLFGGLQGYPPMGGPSTVAMPGLHLGGGWEQPLGPGAVLFSLGGGFPFLPFGGTAAASIFSLMAQAAYAFPLTDDFSLLPGVAAGGLGRILSGEPFSPAFGPRLYGKIGKNGGPLSFFLGGGVDFLVDSGNFTLLPTLEAGLIFRLGKVVRNEPSVPVADATTGSGASETSSQTAPAASQAGTDASGAGTGGAQPADRSGAASQAAGGSGAAPVPPPALVAAGEGDSAGSGASETSSQTGPAASQAGTDAAGAGTGGAQPADRSGAASQAAGGSGAAPVPPPALVAAGEGDSAGSGASEISSQTGPAASQAGTDAAGAGAAPPAGSLSGGSASPLRLLQENYPTEILIDGREGIVLEEFTVYFGPDDSVLQPAERDKLIRVAELLAPYPGNRIIISGHTALAGTEAGRERISRERAQAVRDFLVVCGLEAGRIETFWYSARQPAASNSSNEGRARNRRVEIIVLDEP